MPEPAGALPATAARGLLLAVLAGYVALATAYALRTPPWQAPDEPAHFNYVAQVAADPLSPPRIAPGDWDAARLEALKATRFADGAAIDGIAYEDHQPPAYYYLAALAWRAAPPATADRLRSVRLLGVGLGLITVLAAYAALRTLAPDDPALAVAGAGFVAFLPMQLAVTSAANNDALANAVAAVAFAWAARRVAGRATDRAYVLVGGLVAGLAVLTKLTAAPALAVLAAGEALRPRGEGWQPAARRIAALAAVAAAIALPWAARNARVYGGFDAFGLRAHDAVVVGQPRTAAWIAEHGWAAYLERAASFTFESFWGVFGWLGVFLDARIYGLLVIAAAGAAAGAAAWLAGAWRHPARGSDRRAGALMLVAIALTLAGFAWYNRAFVQHQGRYLFAALPAWAGLFMLGLRTIGRGIGRRLSPRAAGVLGDAAMLGFAAGLAGLAYLALTRYVVPGLS